MNLLHPMRRFTHEMFVAVFERGAAMGRGYSLTATSCGEGPDAIPAVHIRIFEEKKGTSFHATTPFLCRGKIIDCEGDFYAAELERPIEPEEIGVEREALPPRATVHNKYRKKRDPG